MSLYEKMESSMEKRDALAYAEILHPDYRFVRHQSGTEMSRDQMVEMLKVMMDNENVVIQNSRCLYENEDILVEHSLMDFPDGSREAVMSVHTKKEGLIHRTETGATLIEKGD
jgi:hypothetical protein